MLKDTVKYMLYRHEKNEHLNHSCTV